jgi:hypothetical protein
MFLQVRGPHFARCCSVVLSMDITLITTSFVCDVCKCKNGLRQIDGCFGKSLDLCAVDACSEFQTGNWLSRHGFVRGLYPFRQTNARIITGLGYYDFLSFSF